MIKARNKVLVRVSELTGIPSDDILGTSRMQHITIARSLLAWALTYLLGYTTTQAGILMRRHSTTIVYLRKLLTTAIRLPMDVVLIMEDLKEFTKLWTTKK